MNEDPDIQDEKVWVESTGEVVRLRTKRGRPVCPVCGSLWSAGDEHAWHKSGESRPDGTPKVYPSYQICDCCNTEFGNDDTGGSDQSLASVWRLLRSEWLEKVGRCASALAQLRSNLGIDA